MIDFTPFELPAEVQFGRQVLRMGIVGEGQGKQFSLGVSKETAQFVIDPQGAAVFSNNGLSNRCVVKCQPQLLLSIPRVFLCQPPRRIVPGDGQDGLNRPAAD